MTHDELLGKIDETSGWINSTPLSSEFQTRLLNQYNALRAVVELAGKLQDQDPFHEDAGWNAGYNYAMYEVIQAIEKELA